MSEPLRQDQPAVTDPARLYAILVAELTDFAVFLIDPGGRITSWNPGVERLLRYRENDWIGQQVEIIFTPEDRGAGKPGQELSTALREGRSPDVRWHQRQDGTRLFVEGTLVTLRDEVGRHLGFSKVMRDVTARWTNEQERLKSEEQFTYALGASGGVGTWDWDLASDTVHCDVQFAGLYSVDPARAVAGAPLSAFTAAIHPEDRAGVSAAVQDAIRTGTEYGAEYRLLDEDGAVRWIYARGRCHRDADGTPTHFPGIAFEITNRKKAESALRESEGFAQSIVESSPDCVKVLSLEGSVLSMNAGGCRQMELDDFSQCAYRPWLDLWPEAGRPAAANAMARARRGEIARFEGICPTFKGHNRWWEVIVTPIRGVGGHPVRLLVVSRDITARRQVEEELARKAEELARSNADLQQFGFITSHDLQEPLRTMISFSQMLMRRYEGKLDADAGEFLGYIVSAAQRMKSLVDSLLEYSLVVNRGKEAFTQVPLLTAVRSAILNLHGILSETDAAITHDEMPTVTADQTQLVQLFQNLISNAIKYRTADLKPLVHLSAERHGQEWMISVRDNGIGMKPEHHERVFRAFERLHGKEITGTGIGLAICRRIVEKHGGRIWAESEPGHGATFSFTLPG